MLTAHELRRMITCGSCTNVELLQRSAIYAAPLQPSMVHIKVMHVLNIFLIYADVLVCFGRATKALDFKISSHTILQSQHSIRSLLQ